MPMFKRKDEFDRHRRAWWLSSLKPSMRTGFIMLYIIIIAAFYAYYTLIVPQHGDYITYDVPEIDILGRYRCTIPHVGCEYDVFTGWNIGRLMIFTILGMTLPHKYTSIAIYSLTVECLTHSRGGHPRVFTNMLTNIVGYTMGSVALG